VDPDPHWIRIQKFCGSGSGLRKNAESRTDPEPCFKVLLWIRIRIELKSWIRIDSIRIHNPGYIILLNDPQWKNYRNVCETFLRLFHNMYRYGYTFLKTIFISELPFQAKKTRYRIRTKNYHCCQVSKRVVRKI
jgi:hypothetical protein